ncbi:MAG: CHASE2 domain-containing protein, partial [Gammaproteobacteria bacterium]
MNQHTIIRFGLSLVLIALAVLHASGHMRITPLDRLDAFLYDSRLIASLPNTKDHRVIVVDLDEESLAEIGRWPWSRDQLAQMMDNLFDKYHVKVVGFDVLFAEPDSSSGLPVLEQLRQTELGENPAFRDALDQLRPSLQYDRRFAESLQNRQVVLGFAASDVPGLVGALPAPLMPSTHPQVRKINLVERQGITGNLEILQNAAPAGGFFDNALVDEDGIFRRMPLIYVHDGQVYESLSLAMIRLSMGSPDVHFSFADGDATELEAIEVGDIRIPVDQNAAALVPYRGEYGSFNYVSAADIIKGRADPAIIADSFALLGSTAAGLMDLRATPVSNVYPGVEVHANILSGMLSGYFKQSPGYRIGFEAIVLTLFGLALALLLSRLGALMGVVAVVVALAAAAALNWMAWTSLNLSLPLASQLVLIILLFMFHTSYAFFVEARGRRRLGQMFGQYVPPEIVEEMDAKSDLDFGLEGENRHMSVLFSDVRGFTTLSENMDPKQLTTLMNTMLTPMTGVIHKNRGTIDKYMGDAIMAFWGAPLNDPEHATHAVEAGLGMIESLDVINAEFDRRGWPNIKVGVGVNTGSMNVGNMGSEFRMAYTVLGDAVNLGSRLEGLTKFYGALFVVSESTKAEAPGFVYRELDKVKVKGKDEPVAIFEVVGREGQVDEATTSAIKRYQNALKLYRRQQWDQAEINFASL